MTPGQRNGLKRIRAERADGGEYESPADEAARLALNPKSKRKPTVKKAPKSRKKT